MDWVSFASNFPFERTRGMHHCDPINGKKGRRAHAANCRSALKKRRRK